MEIGILTLNTSESADAAVIGRRAEELGFHSLWVPEHAVVPVHTGESVPELYRHFPDPFVTLSRVSAVTDRLKLGTAVCLVPEHHPLILAKQVASLDMYSGGRFVFGVGSGWLREESEILGVDFRRRWTQTMEAIRAMKELWTGETSEFHGDYYDFPPVYHYPKPVSRPGPPVLLGSRSPKVFERIVAGRRRLDPDRRHAGGDRVGARDAGQARGGRRPRPLDFADRSRRRGRRQADDL